MQRFVCTEEIWQEAADRASKQKVFKGSHRQRAANEVGCLGEVLAEIWLRQNGIFFEDERDETTHDYRLRNGKTIDVKTKDRTVVPLPFHDCSVPLYNHGHQRPDYFLFISLRRNKSLTGIERYTDAYVLGALNFAQVEKLGRDIPPGVPDPSNGTILWTGCKNVAIEQLKSPAYVATKWREASSAT